MIRAKLAAKGVVGAGSGGSKAARGGGEGSRRRGGRTAAPEGRTARKNRLYEERTGRRRRRPAEPPAAARVEEEWSGSSGGGGGGGGGGGDCSNGAYEYDYGDSAGDEVDGDARWYVRHVAGIDAADLQKGPPVCPSSILLQFFVSVTAPPPFPCNTSRASHPVWSSRPRCKFCVECGDRFDRSHERVCVSCGADRETLP